MGRIFLIVKGGIIMGNCPFWSNYNQAVECNQECPMKSSTQDKEDCVFRTHLTGVSLKEVTGAVEFSEEIEEDYFIKKFKTSTGY